MRRPFFALGGENKEPLYIAPQFINPLNANGKQNNSAWVCPFWHIAASQKGQKPHLVLRVLHCETACIAVRLPVLVNSKLLAAHDELRWDKAIAKAFAASRSAVLEFDIQAPSNRPRNS